jgi:hypothetical protein
VKSEAPEMIVREIIHQGLEAVLEQIQEIAIDLNDKTDWRRNHGETSGTA